MQSAPKRYRLSPEARADLEEIWRYTADRWSVGQADTYHNSLIREIETLTGAPRRGVSIDHVRPGYRRLRAGSHVIFYRTTGEIIEVIRILHARMDLLRHL